eukprot:CAMPEP_0176477834 /NCGR_PEP_ID=MMETSP0200_2-20121128/853_1 /TAXON_ID=947934 /ORGANISM="Chaetoceros sp., Strain GSL56" /LENGTH=1011 /DNA_ID=CAMNT_0017873709 /DNA_START=329 /DNA_END=3364 /DNA_ORIENTATION=+
MQPCQRYLSVCGFDTPTLKTPDTVNEEDYIEITGATAGSIFLSFDMEDATVNGSPISPVKMSDMTISNKNDVSISTTQDITSFVNMMKSNSDKIKLEAASALLHVLSINHVNTVVQCGAIPVLLDTLQNPKQSVRDECVKCLGMIVGFSPQHRDYVIQAGGLTQLLLCIDKASGDVSLNTVLETLNRFFDHEERPSLALLDQDLPNIVKLLEEKREANVIIHCSKILSYVADGCPQTVQSLLRLGAKGRLMQLLNHGDEAVVVSVLRASRYLVPPKVSTKSRLVTISPIKMSKCNVPIYEQWRVSPLMSLSQSSYNQMAQVDILVCQNVEMFTASEQEVTSLNMMDHSRHGNVAVGQIGFRCIHCATNLEANLQCASIFPASLSSLASSLRQMSWYHFPSCPFLSSTLKRNFSQLTHGVSPFQCMDSLEQYCSTLCEKLGLDNTYPVKSGIVLKKTEEQCKNEQQPSKVLQFEMAALDPLSPETSHTKSQANMFDQKSSENDYDSIDFMPPSFKCHITTDCEKENAMFQEASKGIWKCTQCAKNNIQVPSSVWDGDVSPPTEFIANHAKECPGATAIVKPLTVTSQPNHGNTLCMQLHPAHIHNHQAINNSSQAHVLSSLQRNASSSNANQETRLVLNEDKELVTDFVMITLEQLQPCYLESNKNRYALPKGFPGLECKHCSGTKISRRFFWSCPQRFKNNNSEFAKHLLQCEHCPDSVKQQIKFAKSYHFIQMKKLPRGSLTIFFRRLFRRLHAGNNSSQRIMNTATEESESFFENRKHLLPLDETFPPSPPRETKYLSPANATRMDHASRSMIMSLPGDADWLSDKECYLRENIELFCSTSADLKLISSSSLDRFPNEGQVGLRCVHCSKSLPCKGMSDTDTYAFPTKVQHIRTCLIGLQEHLSHCQHAPASCRKTFEKPLKNCCLQVTRDYYNETLDRLGFLNGRMRGVYARSKGPSVNAMNNIHTLSAQDETFMSGQETNSCDSSYVPHGPAMTPALSGNKRLFEML